MSRLWSWLFGARPKHQVWTPPPRTPEELEADAWYAAYLATCEAEEEAEAARLKNPSA